MHPDTRGDSLYRQFVPHFPSDTNAPSGTQSQRAKEDAWLKENFPETNGRFKTDTRRVFTSHPFPERSTTLLAAIGHTNKYRQRQESDVIYCVEGEEAGMCHVKTFKNGHFHSAHPSWLGPEVTGAGQECLNLDYHGSIISFIDRPRGDAKRSLKKQIGLTDAGNESYVSKDVRSAWLEKRNGRGTLFYVKANQVSEQLTSPTQRYPAQVWTCWHLR